MTAFTLLANSVAENDFGDTRTGGLAGPMGLFIILLLAIGTVLLIRNMNSRLRRLPQTFPSTDTDGPDQGAADTAPSAEETRPTGSDEHRLP
jgi:hypothetical protein